MDCQGFLMRSGNLRHRIIIQEASEGQNAVGEITRSWSTFATRWASIEPLRGREKFEAMQMASNIDHKVNLRYVAGVIPKMRLLFGERILTIQGAINLEERNMELQLMCNEEV